MGHDRTKDGVTKESGMTFYETQLQKIKTQVYPHDTLVKRIIAAKKFIDSHYAKPIDLKNMADTAFISPFHFIRLFKKLYGRTPHQYLQEVRIEKAKKLLQTGKQIKDVCYAVGFSSVSTFSGLFKKITGKTPLKMKKG